MTFLKAKTKLILYLYVPYMTISEQRFFQTVTENNSNFLALNYANKFIFLVTNSWTPLSKFVESAWKERKSKLFRL